jgi:hypothetical protein
MIYVVADWAAEIWIGVGAAVVAVPQWPSGIRSEFRIQQRIAPCAIGEDVVTHSAFVAKSEVVQHVLGAKIVRAAGRLDAMQMKGLKTEVEQKLASLADYALAPAIFA